MRTYFECIPCFVRQTLEAVRLATDDDEIHERVLRQALRTASEMDLRNSPPQMGQRMHRLIRELVGDDPYRQVKEHSNRFALKLYPGLKRTVKEAADPFETALRLAIAGNVIDFGVNSQLRDSDVHDAIEHAMTAHLAPVAVDDFRDATNQAKDILYLADNAGEIVFDRVLIEILAYKRTTFVVKGGPVLNDATMADARMTGLSSLVDVIDNGSDAPGTILDECSDTFRRRFDAADLIVAKGQGNYETLSDVEKNMFFMLKAKCPVIAKDIGCHVGSLVLERSERLIASVEGGGELAGI